MEWKPSMILADWDEEIGPIIVDSLDAGMLLSSDDDNPEVLISRCYISAQSIFAREKFKQINFILPMVSIDRHAIVFLDVVTDSKVRGGKRPFILAIFVPSGTKYAVADTLVETIQPMLISYKQGQRLNLNPIQEETVRILEASQQNEDFTLEALDQEKTLGDMQAGAGGTLKIVIFSCPNCGSAIYPEEVACTRCRVVIRTFCPRCNGLVEKNRKHCPNCSMPNLRFDPDMVLAQGFATPNNNQESNKNALTSDEVIEMTFNEELGLPDEGLEELKKIKRDVQRAGHFRIGGMEREFEDANVNVAAEIDNLKRELSREHGSDPKLPDRARMARTKDILVDSFTRDFTGFKKASKDLQSQSMDESFNEPAVDEVHLLIKSMNIMPPEEPANHEEWRDSLVMEWDCNVFLHAGNRILVGLGSDPARSAPVPGTIFITETTILFFSYLEKHEDIYGILAYFDGGIQSLENFTLAPDISDNMLFFKSHGIFEKKFPTARNVYLHFTWPEDIPREDFSSQATVLQSYLQRFQLNGKVAPMNVGKYAFMTGKHPGDPSIKNLLGEISIYYPGIMRRITDRYPSLK
ncbi:hypothetical protein GF325_03195 [Candidatus Bathyarchaeota archaeon]|nr:hypothetical protein [Candidatus Bathyarchaeota archaeon]